MFSFLQYDFILIGLGVALIIAVASSLLSPFLVLNEQALIADGLAHVSFTGLVIGMILVDKPLLISIPFVIIFSILIKYLSNKKNINGDAALGLVSTVSLAIGFIIIHKSSGFNTSIEGMLVGNLWTVSINELIFAGIVLLLILGFVIFTYKDLLLMTFDYKYAKFKGVKTNVLSYLLAILTAVLIAIGVKTLGTLLISSFVIFPCLIGSQFRKGFFKTLLIGSIMSVFAVTIGITVSDMLDIPASSTIVLTYACILILSIYLNKFIKGESYRD